ncbi:MAG: glycosyltransferase family 2 protein, partial [Bacilli bacterium]|nr:glycosyltransferase family 2 protein [Bacilli bacterium]
MIFSLNSAIAVSKGDYIIRLDAHASYPSNYFSSLANAIEMYGADNVGAVCKTDVLNKTSKSCAIKAVLAHPFGVGNSAFRTGIDKAQEVDTVPFGCWRRSAFERFGKFDERLIRNQDIEFNKRIHHGGGKIVIIPDTYSTYYARETYSKVAKNNYGNGMWNILTVWYTNQLKSLSIRHFIQLLFLLSLIVPTIVSFFWAPAIYVAIASLVLYSLFVMIISAKIAKSQNLNWFYLVATFFVLHSSYGYG